MISQQEPTGTILSSSVNLSNTILGSGMLSMPNALAALGLIFGSAVIILSACASGMGLYLLSRCARRTPGRDSSFFAVSKLTYPNAAVFFDIAIAIKCFGVSISYLIIFGDLMPEIAEAFGVTTHLFLSRGFWITFAIVALIPLAFQRRLDALKYTSFIALLAVAYLFVVVAAFYFNPLRAPLPKGDIVYFRWSKDFFTHLPVFVFAFTCHQNIFTVYNELRDNSSKQVNGTISLSIGSACAIYQWIAILGYLTFGSKVAPNLLTMYGNSMIITLCRLSIAILVLFSYPLQCHPARNCLDKVISSIYRTWTKEPDFEADPHTNDAATSAPIVHVMSPAKHISITTGLMILSYAVSTSVTSLDLVLSFVGSTGSTCISFILPGVFYYKMHLHSRWTRMKVISVLLTLYGVFVLVFCLGANILRVINGDY
ncbi:transmembrane amino acid transporter protein-domain-containing protein [Coemansia spiralis]|nr:transmembrane amino acid transporter protein-domain-containing protein [Coemansia spiralis]